MKARNEHVVNYWHGHYTNKGLCSLCGNSGVIDTRGVRSAAGVECGRLNFCICPNGQVMREQAPDFSQTALEDLRR